MAVSLRLDVLGSSGSGPVPGNPGSGYLVRSGTTTLLLDAGPGTFMRLADLVAPESLAAIVVSHIHPDHCTDIFALYSYLAHRLRFSGSLRLLVPPGAADHLAGFVGSGPDHGFRRTFDITEVDEGDEATVGDITLRFARTTHPVPTVATRVGVGGTSLAYSADTGPEGGFPALAAGAEVVLCEASLDGRERDASSYPYHLSPEEAAAIAAAAGASRLVLTHLGPTLRPDVAEGRARAVFGGDVTVAVPGYLWEAHT